MNEPEEIQNILVEVNKRISIEIMHRPEGELEDDVYIAERGSVQYDDEGVIKFVEVISQSPTELDVAHITGFQHNFPHNIDADTTDLVFEDWAVYIDQQHHEIRQSILDMGITNSKNIQYYLNNKTKPGIRYMVPLAELFELHPTVLYAYFSQPGWQWLDKCKDIWLGEMHKWSLNLIKQIDLDMSTIEMDEATTQEITVIKDLINQAVKDVDFTGVDTVEKLIVYWPHVLLPGPSFVKSQLPTVTVTEEELTPGGVQMTG